MRIGIRTASGGDVVSRYSEKLASPPGSSPFLAWRLIALGLAHVTLLGQVVRPSQMIPYYLLVRYSYLPLYDY